MARRLEDVTYADRRSAGAGHVLVLVGGSVLLGRLLPQTTTTTALCTWVVLGGRSLSREANAVHAHLRRGDLDAARDQVTHLVGRDKQPTGKGEPPRSISVRATPAMGMRAIEL